MSVIKRRPVRVEYLIERDKLSVRAAVDYERDCFSIFPTKGSTFAFVNQTPGSYAGAIGELISYAASVCEQELKNRGQTSGIPPKGVSNKDDCQCSKCQPKQGGTNQAPTIPLTGGLNSKPCGSPTWPKGAQPQKSNALDFSNELVARMLDGKIARTLDGRVVPIANMPPEDMPGVILGPEGEALYKTRVIKHGGEVLGDHTDQEPAGKPATKDNPELTELLCRQERVAALELCIQGSNQKIEIPLSLSYGTAPKPESVRSMPGWSADPNAPIQRGYVYNEDKDGKLVGNREERAP